MRTIGSGLLPWAVAAICLALSWLTSGVVSTQERPLNDVTVIVHCVYYSSDTSNPFRTEARGIEVSGRTNLGLEAGIPCSDAASKLSSLGFAIVNSTSTAGDFDGNGTVDVAGYDSWRHNFGKTTQ